MLNIMSMFIFIFIPICLVIFLHLLFLPLRYFVQYMFFTTDIKLYENKTNYNSKCINKVMSKINIQNVKIYYYITVTILLTLPT